MINRITIGFAAIVMAFSCVSCVKAPDTIHSSSIRIDYGIVNNSEVYTVSFTGALRNESDDTALRNVSGNVKVIDPETGRTVISLPFRLDVILPLSSGELNLRVEKNDRDIVPLLDYLKVEKDLLVTEGTTSGDYLQEKQVRVTDLAFEKVNIIKLLREKL
jgi:hypothetical protein